MEGYKVKKTSKSVTQEQWCEKLFRISVFYFPKSSCNRVQPSTAIRANLRKNLLRKIGFTNSDDYAYSVKRINIVVHTNNMHSEILIRSA